MRWKSLGTRLETDLCFWINQDFDFWGYQLGFPSKVYCTLHVHRIVRKWCSNLKPLSDTLWCIFHLLSACSLCYTVPLFRETATRGRFHQQLHRVTPSDSWNFFAFPRRDSSTKSRTVFYSCNGGNRKLGCIASCNTRSWNFFALQFHEKVSPCNKGLREFLFFCSDLRIGVRLWEMSIRSFQEMAGTSDWCRLTGGVRR